MATSASCADPELSASPAHGPSSGYYEIALDLADADVDAASVTSVRIADNLAYDLRADGDSLHVAVQGAAAPGAADVTLVTPEGEHVFAGAFTYDPPRSDHFRRVVAMGASLTQGVQNGVPTHRGGLVSPPAQLARQLGAYFPIPLLVTPFMPEILPSDIGPPPVCEVPNIVAFVASSAIQVIGTLEGDFANARVDPDIDVHNVAVGGSKVHDLVYGPADDNFAGHFLSHLVFDPHGVGNVETSQLELVEALDPTLVLVTDLFYNDVGAAFLEDRVINPDLITSLDDYDADLRVLLERLADTGAEVFVTNMPRPSLLPAAGEKKARMIEEARAAAAEAGEDEDAAAASAAADADAAIAMTDETALAFNVRLSEVAAEHPTVHVVDAASVVDEASERGVEVGGELLTTEKFGGLLGLDGVHFTDTGYAYFANVIGAAINETLGTDVPPIDLSEVAATDPGAPSALRAGGLDAAECDR